MLRLVDEVDEVTYSWREAITDDEIVELICSHGGRATPGWWAQVRQHRFYLDACGFRPTDAGLIHLPPSIE